MSKTGVSSSKRKGRRSGSPSSKVRLRPKSIGEVTVMGVALSGGKSHKTVISELVYYKEHNKLFLKELYDQVESSDFESGDKMVLDILNQKHVSLVAIDAPLSFPACLQHKCGGIEKCRSKTVQWHWNHYKKIKKTKKNLKLFTPYTERCVERHINYDLEEFYEIPEAFGSNKAPLASRAIFLKNKIKKECIEVFPKLSLFRFGDKFKLSKTHLKNYKHIVRGEQYRRLLLEPLMNKFGLFIYEQDVPKLIESPQAFDSLLSSLTAFLKYKDQCERPPHKFPVQEGWIEFPLKNFSI